MNCKWKMVTVQDLIDAQMIEEPKDGNHGNIHPKSTDYVTQGIPFIMANDLVNGRVDYQHCAYISEKQAKTLKKGFSRPGDVLLTHKATIGRTAIVTDDYETIILTPQVTYYRTKKGILNRYLKYYFDCAYFQNILANWAGAGSTRAYLGISAQKKLPILLPPLEIQKKIAKVLSALDDKIELNNQINKNLEELANALFDNMFPNISQGNRTVGDYIVPKRGKSLLSKDAVLGDVPVVAGGLEPSTYHNESNTTAPVITISASGANAGFVSLWHIPVWSSDSSYIDSKMSDSVYFWYILLKKRQKEIYDSQTGSAQPHIYPQHIAVLPLCELSIESTILFNMRVTSLFAQIANNKAENAILHKTRDTLLTKLMSGEIDVDNVEI